MNEKKEVTVRDDYLFLNMLGMRRKMQKTTYIDILRSILPLYVPINFKKLL